MAYLNTTTSPSFNLRIRSILSGIATRYAQHRAYRSTLNELMGLSDHELNDLGLSRADLHRVALESAQR